MSKYNFVVPSYVKDVLYIKKIERIIGRKLDELDIEAIYHNEPIHFQKPDGQIASFDVRLYRLPEDLMNIELDTAILRQKFEPANFFESTFDFIETARKKKAANE